MPVLTEAMVIMATVPTRAIPTASIPEHAPACKHAASSPAALPAAAAAALSNDDDFSDQGIQIEIDYGDLARSAYQYASI